MSADYSVPPDPRPLPLGQILLQGGLLTDDQLEAVLAIQASMPPDAPGRRLGALVVAQGFATEAQINLAVAGRLDIPIIDLAAMEIPPEMLGRIPKSCALRCGAVAYGVREGRLQVAMVDPTNLAMVEDVRVYAGVRAVDVALAPSAQIDALFNRIYVQDAAQGQRASTAGREPAAATSPTLSGAPPAAGVAMVEFLHRILGAGLLARADHVQLTPETGELWVRFRVDGILADLEKVASALRGETALPG